MWNYRIIKVKHEKGEYLEIGEVYYDENGAPNGSAENSGVSGDTLNELKDTYRMMGEAFDKPTVIFDETKGDIYEEDK